MTGDELVAIRKSFGLSPAKFGRALGYTGDIRATMRRYENGSKDIPPWIARLAIMFERHGIPGDFLADGDQSE
jgi:transcriptional regulator with XRE-family HTH domain